MKNSQPALHRFLRSLAAARPTDVPDVQLIERFLAHRDEAEASARAADRAFEAILARHGPLVEGVCRRLLDDAADVEDAFQATFLVLVRRADSVRVEGSLGPWLAGVARRIATRAGADRQRRRAREAAGHAGSEALPPADAGRSEACAIVREEVARLPERYRSPIHLCLLEGLTYHAAARRLQCPVGTVGVRLARGRELLRARLTRRGLAPAAVALALAPAASPPARAALAAGRLPSPRAAALAAREIGGAFSAKAWAAAAVLAAVSVAVGVTRAVSADPPAPAAVAVDSGPAGGADVPADAAALVAKQEAMVGRIRSLKCTIDLRVSEDAGKTRAPMATCTVARRGATERVRVRNVRIREGDKIVRYDGVSDTLLSPDGVRSLTGFDPDRPPPEPLQPTDRGAGGGRISGMIRPPQPAGPWGYKGGQAADYLALFLPAAAHSLRDLRDATPKATPVARRDDRGDTLWELTLRSADGATDYRIVLSAAHGYAIAETQSTPAAGPARLTRRQQVLEFQEPAPGIFLAKTVRETFAWAPAIVVETVVRDVAVNGPVGDADLAFRFPEGVGVTDTGKKVWYVWGKGAPARTFKTAEEFNEWTRTRLIPPAVPKDRGSAAPAAAGRYAALVREFQAATQEHGRGARAATTDAARQDADRQFRTATAAFARGALALAKADPADPVALPALADAATHGEPTVAAEAVTRLQKHGAADPAVADVVLAVGLSAAPPPGTEALLRDMLARNPSRDARGRAAYALGSLLFSLADIQHPGAAPAPADRIGEADGLMQRVATEFADVKLHPDRPKDTQTLGAAAAAWLRQEEEPRVGQPAPAIDGKDLTGRPLRLSDYRGKVVVLVFWASWCRPCLALIPEEKALAARLAGAPFAILGVNGDATAGTARTAVTARAVPWPNWHDGQPSEGPIAARYRVAGHGLPSVFVIDRDGVLRHKWVGSGPELEKLVRRLLGDGGPDGNAPGASQPHRN